MAYGGTRNPILRTDGGVSLLVGYLLGISTSAISHVLASKAQH